MFLTRRLRSLARLVATPMAMLWLMGACAPWSRNVEATIPRQVTGDLNKADQVFVFLPGVQDRGADFEKKGFLGIARAAFAGRGDVAFIALDAHLGYYRERRIEQRLKDEILVPLAGKKITLVGVSMGGFGALIAARRNPDMVERLVLLAPFLGWPETVERILRKDEPTPGDMVEAEAFAVWDWLAEGAGGIPTALLHGRDDKFRPAFDLLAARAPAVTFRARDGGHDWPTWNTLWADWLAARLAAERAGVESATDSSPSQSSNPN